MSKKTKPAPAENNKQAASASPHAETLTSPQKETTPGFSIIGIGASAGGPAAFEAFFTHLPSDGDLDVTFIIGQHLSQIHNTISDTGARVYNYAGAKGRMRQPLHPPTKQRHGVAARPKPSLPPSKFFTRRTTAATDGFSHPSLWAEGMVAIG